MIWGDPPHVDGLDEYREFMATHGITVRQVYHPAVEIDGEWTEGGWALVAERRETLEDGRVWLSAQETNAGFLAYGKGMGWELQARMIQENRPPSEDVR